MTDKTELEVREGLEAGQILESPVFQASFNELTEEILTEWKRTNARDHEERERLWQMYRLAQMLETKLKNRIASGQMAHKRLTEQRQSRGTNLYG